MTVRVFSYFAPSLSQNCRSSLRWCGKSVPIQHEPVRPEYGNFLETPNQDAPAHVPRFPYRAPASRGAAPPPLPSPPRSPRPAALCLPAAPRRYPSHWFQVRPMQNTFPHIFASFEYDTVNSPSSSSFAGKTVETFRE